MKKILLILLFMLFIPKVNAQNYKSKTHINKVNKIYTSQLNLTNEVSQEIKAILDFYNNKLYQLQYNSNNSKLFNKTLKEYILKIFEVLNEDQFRTFKKLQSEIEPYKKYRL